MEKNLSIVKDQFKELPNNIEAEQAVIGSILVTNEIFDEFYIVRYKLYIDRKDYLLKNLNNELVILKAKREFIYNVINDTIHIYKRKKVEIITDLLKMKTVQVSNSKVVIKYDTNESTTNFDYLIKMSIYLFTEDELDKLEEKINTLTEEYDTLHKLTIEDIWLSELDKLLDYLD